MNIFERASRKKLRFPSPVGALSAEQLWDLPLLVRGAARADLDGIARGINNELKAVSDESFVEVSNDPKRVELQLALDITKHVIASKQADVTAIEIREAKRSERVALLSALANKKDAAIQNMSEDEINAKLAAL